MTSDPQTYPKIYGERGDSNTIRLTDEEREAISRAVDIYEFHWRLADEAHAAALRRLLERTK